MACIIWYNTLSTVGSIPSTTGNDPPSKKIKKIKPSNANIKFGAREPSDTEGVQALGDKEESRGETPYSRQEGSLVHGVSGPLPGPLLRSPGTVVSTLFL